MGTDSAIYPDIGTYLRDELWRVWLLVEYQVRRGWETGVLARAGDLAALGPCTPDHLAALFRSAQADYNGQPLPVGADADAGSQKVLEVFLQHNALLGERVAATLQSGRSLPLVEVARLFDLTQRQCAALTFAILPELDPNLLAAYRYLSQDPSARGLDARLLALLVYDSPQSRAFLSRDLSPRSPLLYYRLLEQEDGRGHPESLLYRRLRPAARLVQLLATGEYELDPELMDVATLHRAPPTGIFAEPVTRQAQAAIQNHAVLLVLQGPRGAGKRLLARMAASREGRPALFIDAGRLLGHPPEVQRALQRALLRDLRLLDAVPVLTDIDEVIGFHNEKEELPAFVTALCREHPGPIVLTISRKQLPRIDQRPLVHITLDVPTTGERGALWRNEASWLATDDADTLAERFAIPGGVIVAAVEAARAARLRGDAPPDLPALDLAVRNQLHDRIMRLGRRLDTPYSANHLVVDHDVLCTLDEIVACVRERRKVREQWGFPGAHGVSVLFSGEPGVGKTMSAKVLGKHLDLAVYEIDLSRVTSKWIGETEKNLSDVFDAGEPGHVLLLFNEADSLFGKRVTDVGTANDRYANLETNYLLQRLEVYGGLAILTTNRASALDPAFRRRFAYDVQFSFPTVEMRAELWQRIIPKQAEVAHLDFDVLAERYQLSGGFIKIAAERAAFMAAAAGCPIGMEIIGRTIERMYRERGKLSTVGKLE